MFLCSVLSCDRKRQSSEQDMKDSLAAANFMKCAKFLYSTFLAPSNLEEQEEYVTFPVFKKLYPLENDLVDTVCAVWLDYTIEDSCTQQSVVNKDSHDIAVTALLQAYIEAKQIQLPQNPVDRYKCIDSIITNNLIPDAELEKDCGNQMQINASFNISEIWTEYLRYHYEKLLEELLKKKSISLPLQTEQEAFDNYWKLKSIILTLLDIVVQLLLLHIANCMVKCMLYILKELWIYTLHYKQRIISLIKSTSQSQIV